MRTVVRTTLLTTVFMVPLMMLGPARAQDASFGCKVLLCAAAAAPSWSGIPYCVPVMQQLFTHLAKGDAWPTCSQGDASPIGYQPYEACPTGSAPISVIQANATGRGGGSQTTYSESAGGSECGAPTPLQSGSSEGCNGAYVGGTAINTNSRSGATALVGGQCLALQPRPTNATPYYVDIRTANGVSRFAFSLQGNGR
jgi:hypothetical protein